MTQFLTLLALTALHFVTGYGIVYLFRIRLKVLPLLGLSVILGISVASLAPFLLQLFYIPLTTKSIFLSLVLSALLLNLKFLADLRHRGSTRFKIQWPRVRLYELPAICLLAFLIFVSAWRGYYYPSNTRDSMSGPETISEYAIKEHTLINSVFDVNLETTNNQYKSPFLTDLQLTYKLAGFPFGNVWLSLIVAGFFIFLYYSLSEKLHKVLAGLLLVCFIATPEAYAYTFLTLYDYSNMVLLFLGYYYLFAFFRNRRWNEFYFSALLMGLAVYIRSETLVLIGMTLPAMAYALYRHRDKLLPSALHLSAFMLITAIFYLIPVELYNNHYLPQAYAIDNLMNKKLYDLSPFFDRLSYMTKTLLFGGRNIQLWGYFIYIFSILFLLELILRRKFSIEARNWLLAVLVIYLGLPLLGFLFPLMDLDNTTKRGLFKILPLMLLYLGNNQVLIKLSERIARWEQG